MLYTLKIYYLLGVGSHMGCIKLLLQFIRFHYYFRSLAKTRTILQFLTNADNSEILENNGRLDIIHSPGGGTYQTTTYVEINVST